MSSAKWRQFCVRDNLLSQLNPPLYYLSYNAYTACEMIQLYHIVIHFMVMMSSCFEWVCVVAMRSSMCWCCEFLTHWGRVTHTCVSKLTINGSHNGLSPARRQAIIWTNNDILIEIHAFSFKKIHFVVSSGRWCPFCLGLNVLTHMPQPNHCFCHGYVIRSQPGIDMTTVHHSLSYKLDCIS